MRGLHRMVVAGAFASLAAATAAASAAFACTVLANVKVTPEGKDYEVSVVAPGATVDIQIRAFYDPTENGRSWTASDVVVVLQSPSGETLTDLVSMPGSRGTRTVQIPAGIPQYPDRPYSVSAYQFNVTDRERPLVGSNSTTLTVWDGTLPKGPPPPPPPAPPPPPPPPPVIPPGGSTPDGGSAAPGGAGTRRATSGPGAASDTPSADPAASAAGPSASAAGPAATATGERAATIPAVPGSAAAELLERLDGQRQPAPADLWSGVDANRTPSLLDAEAPADRSGSIPVGGVLLGLGVLFLMAVTLAEGRRRLAVSRISTRY